MSSRNWLLTGSILALSYGAGARADLSSTIQFDIAAQALAPALLKYSQQSHVQVTSSSDLVDGKLSGPVKGELPAKEALGKLLSGTGLSYEVIDADTVTIHGAQSKDRTQGRSGSKSGSNTGGDAGALGANRMVQNEGLGTSAEGDKKFDGPAETKESLADVVVTGSHIRGAESASPIHVYSRDDIDRSGAASLQDFVQKLPYNLSEASNVSLTAVAGGRGAGLSNAAGGSGVDLRGLGTESTLVLVNGQRIAPGNPAGSFVDISLIPLSAVERVEVVTDGASAIYGSDAVGGVVNFILRKDVEGAETRLRYGSVTEGSSHQFQAGETVGHHWDGGSALLSYEYLGQTPLSAQDRSFSAQASSPFDLLPSQTRQGAFATLDQSVNPDLSFFASANFAKRTNVSDYFSSIPEHGHGDVRSYGGVIGTHVNLNPHASLDLSGNFGTSIVANRYDEIGADAIPISSVAGKSMLYSLDTQISGPLLSIAPGDVQYAIGAQYRKERYHYSDRLNEFGTFNDDRSVGAGYLELHVPILGAPPDSRGGKRLEIVVADRYEHYSDFGSTNNPKIGFIARPVEALTLRGSYGRSFRAPSLSDLNPAPSQVFPLGLTDPLTGGTCNSFAETGTCTNTLFVLGGNSNLSAEKATTWSISVEFRPPAVSDLTLSADFYSIRYEDRIAAPSDSVGLLDFLERENELGSSIIQRNPSLSTVERLAASAGANYVDFLCHCALSTVTAIADSRLHNLSVMTTRGIDFSADYGYELSLGKLRAGFEGTRILKFENQFTQEAPGLDILNTSYNPLRLHLRTHASWEVQQFTGSVYVNHTGAYTDNTDADAITRVASWTTVDASLLWRSNVTSGIAAKTSVTAGVLNIANRNPPYLSNPNYPIHFDGTNANPLGRFLYVQLTKAL